ncbi:MAG: NAD(P)-dependent oxidoreductase [Bacteroidota bacterium]
MTVSILGLGAMGARMAARLLAAGHAVNVWNRTPERAAPLVDAGARLGASPRDAASGAEVVISMVTDDAAARAVWTGPEGAVFGLGPGAVAVESSTLTPAAVAELAEAVTEAGAVFLDAPVAGSRPQAEAGALVYLVGGDAQAVERVRPLFDVLGGAVHHVGPTGQGAAVKLAVNALFATQVAAVAELLAMLQASGVDP